MLRRGVLLRSVKKNRLLMTNATLMEITAAVMPSDSFDSMMILGVVIGVAFLYALSRLAERRNRKA